jgi:hypothetical protein
MLGGCCEHVSGLGKDKAEEHVFTDEDRKAESFTEQWGFITNSARFLLLMCSRRSGKTDGAIRKTERHCVMVPGFRVLYIGHVHLNSKLQFFLPLLDLFDKHKVAYEANRSDLICTLGNGSFIRAVGCDKISEIRKKLGDKWDYIIIDETQDFEDELLRTLIDKALLATLIDKGGRMIVMGTPPVTEAGLFYELWTESEWDKLNWNMLANPYINAAKEIAEVYGPRGIGPGHPIYQREVLGLIAIDPDALVFCYSPERNRLVPEALATVDDRTVWRFSMGIDLGLSDCDAIVVLGWRKDDPAHNLYLCYEWQQNHLDVDELAKVFIAAHKKWHPVAVIGDTGGHGATKVLETLKNRMGGIEMLPKPSSLLDSIALVNDEGRTGRLKVPDKSICAHDFRKTVWKTGKHGVEISSTFHSDVLAALRYAVVAAQHYKGKAPKVESDDDRRIRIWKERQKKESNLYGY